MEAEKLEERGESLQKKTRRLFPGLTLTVKPQARLEGPGLQRYLEASKLFCLVALHPLPFPNSVALLAKEDSMMPLHHRAYRAQSTEVCMGDVGGES